MEILQEEVAPAVLQQGFDPLGPTVRSTVVGSGRTVNFIDEGRPDWQPLLFLGGAGTTVRAFRLMEFARSFREQLRIRIISVERNGLGQTPFDPAVGFVEYGADVWSLLDSLDIGPVSVVAISGGGPYAAWFAAEWPERVRSLHLACAYAENGDAGAVPFNAEKIAEDPADWWRFPANSPVHRVPGFDDSVIEEATRGVFARGRDVSPQGLSQAFELCGNTPLPDLSRVDAPVFTYWGSADPAVPLAQLERWRAALPNVVKNRIYQHEGHDVQYRHWDQILADVAFLGARVVVSVSGKTLLAAPEHAADMLAAGGEVGLAAWAQTGPPPLR
ncbi:alpha/beta fold hydrolase [Arthrobacter sp. A5]|uniref:alpha/beta fold hydrolase n=1 Tax=Arthrobacter sp. A5 TaxID=576926 RepID=UPI003DA95906